MLPSCQWEDVAARTSTRGTNTIPWPRSLSAQATLNPLRAGTAAHELSCTEGRRRRSHFASGTKAGTAIPKAVQPLDKPQLATQATQISWPASTISLADESKAIVRHRTSKCVRLNDENQRLQAPVRQL